MKHLSTGVTKLDQTQYKVRGIYGRFCHVWSYMALVGIWKSFKEHAIWILFCKNKSQVLCRKWVSVMSSYYISFVNYLDKKGSLLISVHKSFGILAGNKKCANFLITGRHGDGAYSF